MKILVNISVPAISENYDVLIPDSLSVRETIPLIAESVEYLSNYRYISSGKEYLCSAERNSLLRPDQTLRDCNIQNGDHLVLM